MKRGGPSDLRDSLAFEPQQKSRWKRLNCSFAKFVVRTKRFPFRHQAFYEAWCILLDYSGTLERRSLVGNG